MSKITGDEIVYPETTTDLEANGLQNTYSYGGITLKQLALKDFMCEIIKFKHPDDNHNPSLVAEIANDYVNAYIDQLNKPIS